jgi:hypothetical protein
MLIIIRQNRKYAEKRSQADLLAKRAVKCILPGIVITTHREVRHYAYQKVGYIALVIIGMTFRMDSIERYSIEWIVENLNDRKRDMVDQEYDFPTLTIDADHASSMIAALLKRLGFHTVSSFDLRTARAARTDCKCPHHATVECNCQMVVMLIYGLRDQPTTLVLHSYDGKTSLSLIDTPQQRIEPGLAHLLRQILLETDSLHSTITQ